MRHLNILIISTLAVFFLFSCTQEKQFSSCSETEQEELYDALTVRLDEYFGSVLQNEEQLQQLFIAGLDDDARLALLLGSVISENDENFNAKDVFAIIKENNAAMENFVTEMLTVCEQWANDNNIDFEDWANTYAEDFSVYYVLHLVELAGKLEE
jgi:fructose-specific component phosphotransferase system IIB-like protein